MIEWLTQRAQPLSSEAREAALSRQQQLTKPPGALGRLESLAVRMAAMQDRPQPQIDSIWITIFAADHGVAAEGVSAFPQAVTAEMVRNFSRGGAAISVLAKSLDARFEVVNVGVASELETLPGVRDESIAAGTANFRRSEAMSPEQLERALDVGRQTVSGDDRPDLFIGGEMGIANTTSAAAVATAIVNKAPQWMVGPGTGVDKDGVQLKATVVEEALILHRSHMDDPLQVLRCLGGFEIAALVGAYIACAQHGIAVLVDGFISSVAALVAVEVNASVAPWLMFSHRSAEPGHKNILDRLGAEPLLDLGMRLGEGSGAAVAAQLLHSACLLHSQMATFAEAGVSQGDEV